RRPPSATHSPHGSQGIAQPSRQSAKKTSASGSPHDADAEETVLVRTLAGPLVEPDADLVSLEGAPIDIRLLHGALEDVRRGLVHVEPQRLLARVDVDGPELGLTARCIDADHLALEDRAGLEVTGPRGVGL